jgi:hypothetical protein
VTGALLAVMLLIAVALPIVAACTGARLRTSAALAALPALLLGLAAAASVPTAWGDAGLGRSEDVSHTYALVVAAILATMAGGFGALVAGVVTRVRRGPGWSRPRR